jgi:hypothetical protein
MRIPIVGLIFLVACGGDGRGGADAATGDASAGDATADSPGPSQTCGATTAKCSDTDFCDYGTNHCGAAPGEAASCRERPAACPLNAGAAIVAGDPACGCDGKLHASTCMVEISGVDLDASGHCDLVPGAFRCGYTQCRLANQYCVHEPQPGGDDVYRCQPLPSTCTGCACLADQPCGDACSGDTAAGLTLTCQ